MAVSEGHFPFARQDNAELAYIGALKIFEQGLVGFKKVIGRYKGGKLRRRREIL